MNSKTVETDKRKTTITIAQYGKCCLLSKSTSCLKAESPPMYHITSY